MNRVRWFDQPSATDKACPVCASSSAKVILEVQDCTDSDLYRSLARCGNCDTLFYTALSEEGRPEHYEDEILIPNECQFSFELRTGIQFCIEVLARVPRERFASYLEVGCGIGASVDFFSSHLGVRAVGVEPSAYGREGERLLKVPIYSQYLEDIEEIADERFGLIASFEVIEHTYDPAAFIATLKSRLQSDGILVFSTPNAAFIQPERPEDDLYPPLFPGEHKVLLTENGLRRLLLDAGFSCVRSDSSAAQLVIYASAVPFELRKKDAGQVYTAYLRQRIDRFDAEGVDNFVVGAYLFRLVAELVGRGRFEEAEVHVERLMRRLGVADEPGLQQLLETARELVGHDLNDYGDRLPYFTGAALYFLGMYHWRHLKSPLSAMQFFAASAEVIGIEVGISRDGFLWPASLLPSAQVYTGCTAIEAGQLRRGVSLIRQALKNPLLNSRLRRRAIRRIVKGLWRSMWHSLSAA